MPHSWPSTGAATPWVEHSASNRAPAGRRTWCQVKDSSRWTSSWRRTCQSRHATIGSVRKALELTRARAPGPAPRREPVPVRARRAARSRSRARCRVRLCPSFASWGSSRTPNRPHTSEIRGKSYRGSRMAQPPDRVAFAPMPSEFLFTSESVTEGHPDKVADQVSDTVLDAVLADDPAGRVACQSVIATGLVVVAGEISTETYVDIPAKVRSKIEEIGYTHSEWGFDATTCGVVVAIDEQSPDIAQGVDASYEVQHDPGDDDPLDKIGAGDQGMMFGYATRETPELMPLPIMLAHKICKRLAEVRKAGILPYLRPDGKSQVTVRYEEDEQGDQRPVEIERILISTQHTDAIDSEALIKPDLIERVLRPILPPELYDEKRLLDDRDFVFVNPTGKFVIGGPMGDTGLTGRKIIIDTYGGAARHGGGAFSGKDPTKVDRSAAYAARYVAKNIVAAELADRCEINVAYAIGVAHPVSIGVQTFGTEVDGITVDRIEELVRAHFDLRPAAILRDLDLRRPIS